MRFSYRQNRNLLLQSVGQHPTCHALQVLKNLNEYVSPLIFRSYKVLHRVHDLNLLLQSQAELLVLFHYNGNTNYVPAVSLWLSQMTLYSLKNTDVFQLLNNDPTLLNEEVGELANNFLLRQVSSNYNGKTSVEYLDDKYVTQKYVAQLKKAFFPSPLNNQTQTHQPSLATSTQNRSQLAVKWLRSLVTTLVAEEEDNCSTETPETPLAKLWPQLHGELPQTLLTELNKTEVLNQCLGRARERFLANNHLYTRVGAELASLFQTDDYAVNLPTPQVEIGSPIPDAALPVFRVSLDPNVDVQTPSTSPDTSDSLSFSSSDEPVSSTTPLLQLRRSKRQRRPRVDSLYETNFSPSPATAFTPSFDSSPFSLAPPGL